MVDLPYDEVAQNDGDAAISSSAYRRSVDVDRETAGTRGAYRVEIDLIRRQIR
jgi:hypothetical protein